MIIPVILAGGSGTRLWPISRELFPKQLLPLVDNHTMLQNTILRLLGIQNIDSPLIICNENHRFLVAEQLRAIGMAKRPIILEPFGRNTAPAIAMAAIHLSTVESDPVLLVLPADHHIADMDSFKAALAIGEQLSLDHHLVTFGIVPDSPHTGYGYIQRGEAIISTVGHAEGLKIARFVEKPDRMTAERYIDSGEYFWNSGMFMFLASTILEELNRFAPKIVDSCAEALAKASKSPDFCRPSADAFALSPSDSIDYAVMEKTDRGIMVPLSAGWNDLGSWDAMWEIRRKDRDGNVLVGDTLTEGVNHSYIHATSRLVAAIGIQDQVVVETPDAIFLAPWDRVQEVKSLVQKMKSHNRPEVSSHRKEYRTWGNCEEIASEPRFVVRRIMVRPETRLPLHKHNHRAEHWVVVQGTALVSVEGHTTLLSENESVYIPIGSSHALENSGKIPLELIEVQSGNSLGDNDFIQLEDDAERDERCR